MGMHFTQLLRIECGDSQHITSYAEISLCHNGLKQSRSAILGPSHIKNDIQHNINLEHSRRDPVNK